MIWFFSFVESSETNSCHVGPTAFTLTSMVLDGSTLYIGKATARLPTTLFDQGSLAILILRPESGKRYQPSKLSFLHSSLYQLPTHRSRPISIIGHHVVRLTPCTYASRIQHTIKPMTKDNCTASFHTAGVLVTITVVLFSHTTVVHLRCGTTIMGITSWVTMTEHQSLMHFLFDHCLPYIDADNGGVCQCIT
jgi:hypothetical protein